MVVATVVSHGSSHSSTDIAGAIMMSHGSSMVVATVVADKSNEST